MPILDFGWLGSTSTQNVILTAGAVGTFFAIRTASKDARRRATIDIVIHHQKDEDLLAAKRTVTSLRRSGQSLSSNLPGSTEYQAILDVLNAYEFVSSGIREGAFDEKIYKRVFCSMLIRDWEATAGFVLELRNTTGKKTLFQDYEKLARRWERRPLKMG